MKIAYLVFAYKNPKLIQQIVKHLEGDDDAFFVHIDAKFPIAPFQAIQGRNLFFTEQRIPVYWAEFSGVEAILLLMRTALARPERYDYFVLLSGSEFALRSRAYIRRFFEENRGREFITMKKMPAPGKPISRLNTLRFPSTRPLLRFLFRALGKFGLAQRDYRKHFEGLEPYSGVTWWTLSADACRYVVDYAGKHPKLSEFFRNAHAPEETFVHTILGNSPFQPRIRRNLNYEEWLSYGNPNHPEMISAKHVAWFESQDKVEVDDLHGPGELLFARKFSDDSLPLVERILAMIERKEKLSSHAN